MDNTEMMNAHIARVNAQIAALVLRKNDDDISSVLPDWKPTPVKRNSVELTRDEIIKVLDQLEHIVCNERRNISLRVVLKAQERHDLLSEKQAQWLERKIKWYGI